MLLLGVLAAQAEGAAPGVPGDYELLESEILTGSQASVTFSDLNSTYGSTYQHLQLRMTARSDVAGNSDSLVANFNSDTGSNYAWHRMWGDGSSAQSDGASSQTFLRTGVISGDTSTADSFAGLVMDILDPFETTKNTSLKTLSGQTSSFFIFQWSGLWLSTAAVTTITLEPQNGSNFVSESRFSLYGLRSVAV